MQFSLKQIALFVDITLQYVLSYSRKGFSRHYGGLEGKDLDLLLTFYTKTRQLFRAILGPLSRVPRKHRYLQLE